MAEVRLDKGTSGDEVLYVCGYFFHRPDENLSAKQIGQADAIRILLDLGMSGEEIADKMAGLPPKEGA